MIILYWKNFEDLKRIVTNELSVFKSWNILFFSFNHHCHIQDKIEAKKVKWNMDVAAKNTTTTTMMMMLKMMVTTWCAILLFIRVWIPSFYSSTLLHFYMHFHVYLRQPCILMTYFVYIYLIKNLDNTLG